GRERDRIGLLRHRQRDHVRHLHGRHVDDDIHHVDHAGRFARAGRERRCRPVHPDAHHAQLQRLGLRRPGRDDHLVCVAVRRRRDCLRCLPHPCLRHTRDLHGHAEDHRQPRLERQRHGRREGRQSVAGAPGGTPWARGFGGAASDVGYGVAVDASGNAVMTGRVESTVDFGGGVVCPPAAVFVSKYSPTGATVWSKCLGGVLGGGTGRAVAVDASGNVLVTGKFSGTVDFGTGALTSAGASSIFVAHYSAAGAPVWSTAFGGGLNDVGNGVAVDRGGNVVIIGTASGTVSFGGSPITANGYTIVVAKFSPAGA